MSRRSPQCRLLCGGKTKASARVTARCHRQNGKRFGASQPAGGKFDGGPSVGYRSSPPNAMHEWAFAEAGPDPSDQGVGEHPKIIAFITEPPVIRAILESVRPAPRHPRPARATPHPACSNRAATREETEGRGVRRRRRLPKRAHALPGDPRVPGRWDRGDRVA